MKNKNSIKDPRIYEICDEVEKSLHSILDESIQEIILYGSYARGEQEADSDLDIIVLVDDDNLSYYRKKVNDLRVELSLKYDIVLSIIIKNYAHYMKNVNVIPYYENIHREGIELYGE